MATCCCCSARHRPSPFLGSPLRHPGVSVDDKTPREISLSVVSSISDISSNDWDACATDATSPEKFNPFISHAFLSSLEESRSAIKCPVTNDMFHVLWSHSYGEYVFDHSWADAYYRYGSQYYPKLQSCVPFTPVTSHRILVRNTWYRDQVFDMLVMALKDLTTQVLAHNLKMKRLFGDEIKTYFDKSFIMYRWGSAYLTRDFFHILGSKMGDRILLIAAEDEGELVAGALNLIGGDTLFGRLWGCLPHVYFPNLHFEACYYQAIEAAIDLNLTKVEAGAQGEHKIQRGYLPVTTFSCHYILDDDFRKVIDNFLVYETEQVKHVMQLLHESGPFKEGII
ncbi:hypothetical protein MUK42_35271 [Musa troglodytarum]|uniref:Acyl-CoA N-acyltransferase n=1 Tax=Musa troglodytarum TaxID=320322 RepID=A0A9E7HGM8_9LILI|nr:hypothetical protein MUK42_35271 [Musa troglodytarum]